MKLLSRLAVVVVFLMGVTPALAQSNWSYSITPTVWGAGLNGDIQIGPFEDALRVNFSDGFGGSEIGGLVEFEANNGRLGVIAEAIVLNVSGGAEPPSILTETADVDVDHVVLNVAATYRLRHARPAIDFVLGVRYFDVDTKIRIRKDGDIVRQGAASEDWVDGTFGARVRYEFGEKWSALGHLDFGAGDSELSYHLILGGQYRFSQRTALTFGYKLISTDFQIATTSDTDPPFTINTFHYSSMKLGGPWIGWKYGW